MADPMIIVCPGQGAQALGMGKVWAETSAEARAVFDEADQVLGTSLGQTLSSICWAGPAEILNRTDVSQPALYTCAIACWRGLCAQWGLAEGEAPVKAAAGLSLGEYSLVQLCGRTPARGAARQGDAERCRSCPERHGRARGRR